MPYRMATGGYKAKPKFHWVWKGRGIVATLKTPIKIRELQRKLYLKTKQEKNFRFYLLYDKVYRQDILSHAYELVRANKGVCGVDGMTFKSIEEGEGGVGRYLMQIAWVKK